MTANLRGAAAGLLLLAAGCASVSTPTAPTLPAPAAVTSVSPVNRVELPVTSEAEKKYPNFEIQLAKALAGDANEQFILAGMHERGEGAPRSYDEAAKWYRLAADQGHAAAQFYLGAMYGSARGVARSYKAAIWWYSKSAAQGYRDALYPMAFAYEYGIGVTGGINLPLAIEWYLKSADAGVWQAMERLGKAYRNGELGVTADPEKAKEWLVKSTSTRNASAK